MSSFDMVICLEVLKGLSKVYSYYSSTNCWWPGFCCNKCVETRV